MTATIYEKSGHYYILVQWSEHGKRFRKNCATGLAATTKNERKAEKGRVAEMKSAARPFMRRPKEYVADRLWKNKRLGKEKGMAKQTLG